jgi:hypothetical protein
VAVLEEAHQEAAALAAVLVVVVSLEAVLAVAGKTNVINKKIPIV